MRFSYNKHAVVGFRVVGLPAVGLPDGLQPKSYLRVLRSWRIRQSLIIQRMHLSYTNHAVFGLLDVGLPVFGLSDGLRLFNRCVSLHLQLSKGYAEYSFLLLSDGPRPGIPSQSRSNGQLGCKGIGAKSLDRDLGDVYTWPHSHYLVRPCNGVGG